MRAWSSCLLGRVRARRFRSGVGAVSIACLLIGCGEISVKLVWPAEMDRAFVVVIPEDWGGTSAELQIGSGVEPAADVPSRVLVAPGSRVLLLGLEESSATSVHPRVSDLASWSLAPKSVALASDPSCQTSGWVHSDVALELPIGSSQLGARSFELDDGDGAFRPSDASVLHEALSFRASLEPCFSGRRLEVSVFSSELADPSFQFYQVQYLDADTIFVPHIRGLEVLRRGERVGDNRRLSNLDVSLPDASELSWAFWTAALRGNGDEARGVVALVVREEQFSESRLHALHLDSDGVSLGPELWRETVNSGGVTRAIEAIAIDERGAWVAVGRGLIVTATASDARPIVLDLPQAWDLRFAAATGRADPAFVVAGGTFIKWLDPKRGADGLTDADFGVALAPNQRLDALLVEDRGSDLALQVLTSQADMARRSSAASPWTVSPVWTDEAEAGCTHRRLCGRAQAAQRGTLLVGGFDPIRPTSLVAPSTCQRVYLVDEASSCAISVAIAPVSGAVGTQEDGGMSYGARLGDKVVIVGERGRIFELGAR